jgi:hypothetical protein
MIAQSVIFKHEINHAEWLFPLELHTITSGGLILLISLIMLISLIVFIPGIHKLEAFSLVLEAEINPAAVFALFFRRTKGYASRS